MEQENKFDLQSLKNEAKQLTGESENNDVIITDDSDVVSEEEYTGPGVSISKEDYEKMVADKNRKGIVIDPSNQKESQDGVQSALDDLDEQIAIEKAKSEQIKESLKFNALQTVEVLIDKTGLGKIEFTDEEKAKLQHADKIVLIEQSEEKFKNIKIKKRTSGKDLKSVAEKVFDKSLSQFVNVASGYCGKMGNISSAEAITLIDNDGDNTAESLTEKWSILYKKIKYTSIGKFESFDQFLKETALSDYSVMVYALVCASYPDKDKIILTCGNEKCKQTFEHEYETSKLIRTDLIKPELAGRVYDIVSKQTFIDEAKKVHESSPVKTIDRVSITEDDSILLDIYVPSAYEGIERMYRQLNEKYTQKKYFPLWSMLHFIRNAYLLDEDGEYVVIEDPNDIMENVLLNLTEYQIKRLNVLCEKKSANLTFDFGLKSIECPKCHHKIENYDIPVEALLFLRVRRLLDTEIG